MRKATFSSIPQVARSGALTGLTLALISGLPAPAGAQEAAPARSPGTAPEPKAGSTPKPAPGESTPPASEADPNADASEADATSEREGAEPEANESGSEADTRTQSEGSGAATAREDDAGTSEAGTQERPTRPAPVGAGAQLEAEESTDVDFGAYPNPVEDEEGLGETGDETDGKTEGDAIDEERVFAQDWWAHTRPALELHGNFRVRAELYDHFSLGRIDPPGSAIWPRPADDFYTDVNGGQHGAQACTPAEAGTVGGSDSPADANVGCSNSTQAGANLRFRLEPTIIISDNLRIRSQIDLFDNLVLGSTAAGNINFPAASGYSANQRSGYYPVSAQTDTQESVITGINSVQDSIAVQRAWAEYETPVGQVRFGRMPDHWGLGLFHNAGDGIDADYQSTVDRIAVYTGLPALSLYAAGAWDFPYEGPTSAAFTPVGGQPYDLAQLDDVTQANLMLFRRVDPQLEALMLARGEIVVNGGLYLTYAFQRIANDLSGPSATCNNGAAAIDCQPGEVGSGFVRRGYERWTPDLFAEVKYGKFHAAFEFVTHQGTFQSLATQAEDNDFESPTSDEEGWRINQYGFAGEITQKLIEDRLKLGFYFGWASGDGDVEGLIPGDDGLSDQIGDRSIDTFRFHPGYRVDLILHRNLLTRVQGTYYFKPMAQYDFIRDAKGMRLGGRAEAIWTRASEFMQAPGHEHDLGIELNGSVYYQSTDGALNDEPGVLGGFFAMAQYGVLFPLSGLGYQDLVTDVNGNAPELQTAQMVRVFLGVAY